MRFWRRGVDDPEPADTDTTTAAPAESPPAPPAEPTAEPGGGWFGDRKSTRLNSSHNA